MPIELSPGIAPSVREPRGPLPPGIGLLIVLLVSGGLKLALASGMPASPGLADDYDYLHQSVHFTQGNWQRLNHPFPKVANTGPAYALLISPWMLFEGHRLRVFVVSSINVLLSTATILFGTLAVWDTTRKRSLLVPTALALYSPVFIFGFYAMTENLLLAVAAALAWQVVDLESVLKRPWRLACLLFSVALAPLERDPGFAVLPALLLVLWIRRRHLGRHGWWRLSAGVVVATVIPYLLIHRYLLGPGPHGDYLSYLAGLFHGRLAVSVLAYVAGLAEAQITYVLIAGGFFTLPLFLISAWRLCASPATRACRRAVDLMVFSGGAAAIFIAFCLVHLVRKVDFEPGRWKVVFGRYDEPAALLIVLGGLAGALAFRPATSPQRMLLRLLPALGVGAFFLVHGAAYWMPLRESGLTLFTVFSLLPSRALTVLLMAAVVVGLGVVGSLALSRRFGTAVVFAVFILYHAGCVGVGLHMIGDRVARIAYSLEAADWLSANTPSDARVGCDLAVAGKRAPQGVRTMSDVYRALGIAVHPRPVEMVDLATDPVDCDYFFTLRDAVGGLGWPIVWENRHYVLYRLP